MFLKHYLYLKYWTISVSFLHFLCIYKFYFGLSLIITILFAQKSPFYLHRCHHFILARKSPFYFAQRSPFYFGTKITILFCTNNTILFLHKNHHFLLHKNHHFLLHKYHHFISAQISPFYFCTKITTLFAEINITNLYVHKNHHSICIIIIPSYAQKTPFYFAKLSPFYGDFCAKLTNFDETLMNSDEL